MDGHTINGYHVEKLLGKGSFGLTYLVKKNETKYAMKVFKNEHLVDHDDHRRVDREIKALQSITHTHIVNYIDDGMVTIGTESHRYLVMEYVEGTTLDKVIEKHGKLTVEQVQRYAIQLIKGIKAIHDANMYHRDLKPGNIFVSSLGDIKILDFGLAKLIDASTLTTTGTAMGTYAYMPKEQLTNAKDVDHRSDLYSFGAILFHMITGRLPLEFKSIPEAIYKITSETPPFASSINPNIPNSLDNLIASLLEKEVFNRPDHIPELLKTLQNLNEKPITKTFKNDLTPKFLPRLLHTEKTLINNFASNHELDGIVFPANFIPKYQASYDFVRNIGKDTMLDPLVYRLAYSKFSNTKSLVDLPYVLDKFNKEMPRDFNTEQACKHRAISTLEFQLQKEPTNLIAPFHFIEDLKSEWLNIDAKVFHECRLYINENKIPQRLYAGLCINIESISDKESRREIINYLTRMGADGYILMLNINLNSNNKAHYYAYAALVKMLSSQNKPIILSRINDFGLGLIGLGATAISSGIGYIESFDESILMEETQAFGLKAKFYIPELMSSFSEPQLRDIYDTELGKQFICKCDYCKGSTDTRKLFSSSHQKYHYLYQRSKQMEQLNALELNERLPWFLEQLKTAEKHCQQLSKQGLKINFKHLSIWHESLSEASRTQQVVAI
ncbi:serine/threonine protein kinase [Bacillus cereus]|uniref:serine/threonine protein kinase n=1 Tax=Bacillus cereus TaxID=1396 RepID=UPI003D174492